MGLDLKPYFNSNLAHHQVEELYNFESFDSDRRYKMIPSSELSLIQVLLNKDGLIPHNKEPNNLEHDFEVEDEAEGESGSCICFKKKIHIPRMHRRNKEVQKYRIEYSIVNMSELIGLTSNENPRSVIKLISDLSASDISYLEIEVLQVIIRYKWRAYT